MATTRRQPFRRGTANTASSEVTRVRPVDRHQGHAAKILARLGNIPRYGCGHTHPVYFYRPSGGDAVGGQHRGSPLGPTRRPLLQAALRVQPRRPTSSRESRLQPPPPPGHGVRPRGRCAACHSGSRDSTNHDRGLPSSRPITEDGTFDTDSSPSSVSRYRPFLDSATSPLGDESVDNPPQCPRCRTAG